MPLASEDVFASEGCVFEGMSGASGIEAREGEWRKRRGRETAVGFVMGFCYFCVTEPNL